MHAIECEERSMALTATATTAADQGTDAAAEDLELAQAGLQEIRPLLTISGASSAASDAPHAAYTAGRCPHTRTYTHTHTHARALTLAHKCA